MKNIQKPIADDLYIKLKLQKSIIVRKMLKWKIPKCIWRMRMRVFTRRVQKIRDAPASYIVLDAPSGYGKTFFMERIRELIPAGVKRMSGEEFLLLFYPFFLDRNYKYKAYPMEEVFKDVKVIVIEDIDLCLAGKERSQEGVANVLLGAIENDCSVVVTGIDIAKKVPYFFWRMENMYGRTKKHIFSK